MKHDYLGCKNKCSKKVLSIIPSDDGILITYDDGTYTTASKDVLSKELAGKEDKDTVQVVDGKVVAKQIEDTNTIQFTGNGITVDTSQISELVFRQIDQNKNPSNRIMLCTGVKVGDEWYGDRPDRGSYLNPFTNETIEDNTPVEVHQAQFLYKENPNGNTIEIIGFTENDAAPILSVSEYGNKESPNPDEVLTPTEVIDVLLQGKPAKAYKYTLPEGLVRNQSKEHLKWHLSGREYETDDLPRLNPQSDPAGVFGYIADDISTLYYNMPDYQEPIEE